MNNSSRTTGYRSEPFFGPGEFTPKQCRRKPGRCKLCQAKWDWVKGKLQVIEPPARIAEGSMLVCMHCHATAPGREAEAASYDLEATDQPTVQPVKADTDWISPWLKPGDLETLRACGVDLAKVG